MKNTPAPSLDDPIQFIKGVGPRKTILLEKLRITSIEDFLYFLPFRFEDRTQFKKISQAVPDEYVTLTGEVLNAGTMFMGRRKGYLKSSFRMKQESSGQNGSGLTKAI